MNIQLTNGYGPSGLRIVLGGAVRQMKQFPRKGLLKHLVEHGFVCQDAHGRNRPIINLQHHTGVNLESDDMLLLWREVDKQLRVRLLTQAVKINELTKGSKGGKSGDSAA